MLKLNLLTRVLLFFLGAFIFFSCEDNDPTNTKRPTLTFALNKNLPTNVDTLRVLSIGNSFTEDAMWYVPEILRKMHINNIHLAQATYTACTLSKHYELYQGDSASYYFAVNKGLNGNWTKFRNYKLKDALKSEKWDIIILQQLSNQAGLYSTYEPYLSKLLNKIYSEIGNKKVVFGWHMTWSYASNSNRVGFEKFGNNQITMLDSVINASKKLAENIGLDLIIPSGTTLQNLRNTKLNNPPLDLTRDGSHADLGIARYSLACSWINTIVRDMWKKDIVEIPYIKVNKGIPLSLENYKICQKAAEDACINKYQVTK